MRVCRSASWTRKRPGPPSSTWPKSARSRSEMRYVDEYRGEREAREYAAAIGRVVHRPWTVMEVCGGQTHAILKFGLTELIPREVNLVHGPGCPVCVTPLEL